MELFSSLFASTSKGVSKSVQSSSSELIREKERENIKAALLVFCICVGIYTIICQSSYSLSLINVAFVVLQFVLAIIFTQHRNLYCCLFNLLTITYTPIIMRTSNGLFAAYCVSFISPIFSLIFTNAIYSTIVLISSIYFLKTPITKGFNQLWLTGFQKETEEFINLTILYAVSFYFAVYYYSRINQKYQDQCVESKTQEHEFIHQNSFFVNVSHEIRNSLNSILGNLELSLVEKLPADVRELLTNSQICGEFLLHLINNVLDSGKAATDNLDLKVADCSIYQVCEKIWAISSRLMTQKGLKGSLSISKNVPRVIKADSYRITQILLNLIGNAVKFTDHGQIKIVVDWIPSETQITDQTYKPIPYEDAEDEEGISEKNAAISSYLGGESYEVLTHKIKKFRDLGPMPITDSATGILRITIIDTGCGLAEGDKEKIFQKFTQGDSNTPKKSVGTGLGLFISQELIKNMGGEIRVFSKRGKGSSFVLCIPASASAYKPPSKMQDLRKAIGLWPSSKSPMNRVRNVGDKRLLLVDASKWNVSIITNYLNKIDISSTCAFTGSEAVSQFEQAHKEGKPYAAIIMDCDMPEMNGKEALIMIRKYERENGLKPCLAVVSSSEFDKRIIDDLLDPHGEARADFYLKKPITFEQLSELICKL